MSNLTRPRSRSRSRSRTRTRSRSRSRSVSNSSPSQLILDLLKTCKFGIEFESCFCISENNTIVNNNRDKVLDILVKKFNKFSCNTEFNLVKDTDEFENDNSPNKYKVWNIVEDLSLGCDTGNSEFLYYTKKGMKTKKSNNVDIQTCSNNELFNSAEFISPVYDFPEGILELGKIFNNCFNNNIIFEVNRSQGFHINISSSLMNGETMMYKLNMLRFIKAWWYFEDVFFKLVDISRCNLRGAGTYCAPLRKQFTDYQDIENRWEKFYMNSMLKKETVNKESKHMALSVKDNRFEIRIIEGTADITLMLNWIVLLNYFMISTLIKDIPSLEYNTPEKKFVLLFTYFLPQNDSNVKKIYKYFRDKFRI